MAVNLLSDGNIEALAIVSKGANRKRIFLKKEHSADADLIEFPGSRQIIKAAGEGWSRFYCVVAEPGALEDPGVLAGDQSVPDRWASEDEIRKAQASFMRNGGLVNRMHESLEPYGQLVENAIALTDFAVDGETIRKGSWYVAIEPTEEGKSKIDAGEFTGISIQGTAVRTEVEKATETELPAELVAWAEQRVAIGKLGDWRERIAKDAALVPNIPGKTNWVERAGGLPKFLADIAGDLITEKGKSVSNAIQMAWGICRNWCSGKGNVTAPTRAKACAAAAAMDAKAASAGGRGKVAKGERWTLPRPEQVEAVLADLEKRVPFDEQKHPRAKGRFAPKGSTSTSTATSTKASTPEEATKNRNTTAANILGTLGFRGQKLGDALREFQKKNGLKPTGQADPQTMVALRSKIAGARKKRAKVKKADSPVWASIAR